MSKYARPEHERRFLLSALPPGKVERVAEIVDRYIEGTRLRLRRMTVDGRSTRKLTQKVPGFLTTIYVDEAEYARLATLPARVLEKTRHTLPPFGVDVFAAPREGLLLAEVEFDDADAMRRFEPPSWIVAEVTDDVRFTGGRLAQIEGENVRALMAEFRPWRRS